MPGVNILLSRHTEETLTREMQEQVARVFIAAWAQYCLLDRSEYFELFRNHTLAFTQGWLPRELTLVCQVQEIRRLFLQHNEEREPVLQVSRPNLGEILVQDVQALKLLLNTGSSGHLFQESSGVRLAWHEAGGHYRLSAADHPLNAGDFGILSFRVAQSHESPNTPGSDQDFTLRIADGEHFFEVPISELTRLVFPGNPVDTEPKTVMQSVRLPIQRLREAGLDVTRLTEVSLIFNRLASGILYLDDLQLAGG